MSDMAVETMIRGVGGCMEYPNPNPTYPKAGPS